jgi:hypothetical protein
MDKFVKTFILILIITVSLFVFGIMLFFVDLIYINQESGVMVELYQAKDCSQTNSTGCLIYGKATSNNLFKRTSLEEALDKVLDTLQDGSSLKTFSKNISDWDCSLNGKVIENKKGQRGWSSNGQIVYKCWPNK